MISGHDDNQAGSATIWFTAVVAGLVAVALLLTAAGGVWSTKTHLQAVADMGALAGADLSSVAVFEVNADSARACSQAAAVVEANGATVGECWTSEGDTFVVAQKPVRIVGWALNVKARSRAGPPPQ